MTIIDYTVEVVGNTFEQVNGSRAWLFPFEIEYSEGETSDLLRCDFTDLLNFMQDDIDGYAAHRKEGRVLVDNERHKLGGINVKFMGNSGGEAIDIGYSYTFSEFLRDVITEQDLINFVKSSNAKWSKEKECAVCWGGGEIDVDGDMRTIDCPYCNGSGTVSGG